MEDETTTAPLPARMLNEWVYCPRLFHLEHVQRLFVDNGATVEGRGQHERGKATTRQRELDGEVPWDPASVREHTFVSRDGRISGKFDAVGATADGALVPVEAKRGEGPAEGSEFDVLGRRIPPGVWPPDYVQVAAQALLVRDAGHRCREARIHYRASRRTVTVEVDDFALDLVRAVEVEARKTAAGPMPPPLVDSPKCFGCSMNPVCLPDETNLMNGVATDAPRKLVPGRADGGALYVLSQGAQVGKEGETLVVRHRDERSPEIVPVKDVEHVTLFGHAQMTTQALALLMDQGKEVFWLRRSGRLVAAATPPGAPNVATRRAQFRFADDPAACLVAARALVSAKLANQRTLVRRNLAEHPAADGWLDTLRAARAAAGSASTLDEARGHEGAGARAYFDALREWLVRGGRADLGFDGRNRRPPRDPVNAALSFGYALLASDAAAAVRRVGLDADVGFFHQQVAGRPSLALDVMEPFRPLVVDSLVIRAFLTGEMRASMFVTVEGAGMRMTDAGRRALLEAYERRIDELVTHPQFDYRMSYRRCIELDARLLARFLVSDVKSWLPMTTR